MTHIFLEVTWSEFIADICGCQFDRGPAGRLFSVRNPHLGTIGGSGIYLSVLTQHLTLYTRNVPRVWFLRARKLPECRIDR